MGEVHTLVTLVERRRRWLTEGLVCRDMSAITMSSGSGLMDILLTVSHRLYYQLRNPVAQRTHVSVVV